MDIGNGGSYNVNFFCGGISPRDKLTLYKEIFPAFILNGSG